MSLIWESPSGDQRLWAGSIKAFDMDKLQRNKIKILQPVTGKHVGPPIAKAEHFKFADITRLVNTNAIDELIMQLARADDALLRLAEEEVGIFVYCKQGCNRTPVWCIAFLMAKTGRPLSTCSKHYTDMRSLTYLDVKASQFLQTHEGKLRNAFIEVHPRSLAPLPVILEEDAWNELAAQRHGGFLENETTAEDDAQLRIDASCFTRSKKQKLEGPSRKVEITENDDVSDKADSMPDLAPAADYDDLGVDYSPDTTDDIDDMHDMHDGDPADANDTGGSLSASSSTLPMVKPVTPPPEVIDVVEIPTPWPPPPSHPSTQQTPASNQAPRPDGQDGTPLPSGGPAKTDDPQSAQTQCL